MSAVPFWRRLDPASARARLLAGAGVGAGLLALAALALAPLALRIAELDARAAALAAGVTRLERAAAQPSAAARAPSAAARAAAAAWLDTAVPVAARGVAALELLGAAQAMAAQAGARVTGVAALDGAEGLPTPAAGLHVVAVEARITADHAALATLLEIAAARPDLRIVALEAQARTADPLREADRLAVRLAIAALRRDPGA